MGEGNCSFRRFRCLSFIIKKKRSVQTSAPGQQLPADGDLLLGLGLGIEQPER